MNSDEDHEEEHIGHGEYCPRRSLEIALSDWLPVFFNSNVPTDSQLNLEDLKLLSDLYYLPYEYGTDAIKMFCQINYCLKNYRDCSLEDSEDSKLRNRISKLNELIRYSTNEQLNQFNAALVNEERNKRQDADEPKTKRAKLL